jgi:hypothetical protein
MSHVNTSSPSGRLAASAVLTLGALTASLLTATTASADTLGCVARSEYRSVSKGMSKRHVANIFDTAGSRMSIASSGGYTVEIRSYKTCLQFSSVVIAYENGRLSNKSAVWVY